MDNLINCCFFCLKSIPDYYLTAENNEKVCRFFKMVQRHVGSSFLLKQLNTAIQFKNLLNDGDILPCSECLRVLETFNELYDQLKIIELKTNMVMAQIGKIIRSSNKGKTCLDQNDKTHSNGKLTMDTLNWVRQELQFKCSTQLAKQFPRVAVKRRKLDKIIKEELCDDIKPNVCSMIMTQISLGTTPILLEMTSLKIVLQLSLINTAGIWNPADMHHEQLTFQKNCVRNILVVMASLNIVFNMTLMSSANYATLENPPTEAVEISVDEDQHQCESSKKFNGVTSDNLMEQDVPCNTAVDVKPEVPKVSKDLLECHRCHQKFDNFSSLKYHWLRCDLKEVKPSSIRPTAETAHMLVKTKTNREFETETIEKVAKNKIADYSASSNKPHETVHQKSFACTKCPKKFSSEKLLKSHQLTHSDESTWPHPCSVCGKRFIEKRSMQMHVLKRHPNDPITRSIRHEIQCRINQSTGRSSQPAKIFRQCASQPKRYVCQKCDKNFNSSKAYNYHMKKFHSNPESWEHCCSFCGKRFIEQYLLKTHLRTHTKEKPFACLECGDKFMYSTSRTRHMLIWHGPVS